MITTGRSGKSKLGFVEKKFRRVGDNVWSYAGRRNDVHAALKWSTIQNVSRCGKHLLVRRTGVPMGSSLSSAKAEMQVCGQEASWLRNRQEQRAEGFIRGDETHCEVVGSTRYADDILGQSTVLCSGCVEAWQHKQYSGPLTIECDPPATTMDYCDLTVWESAILNGSRQDYHRQERKVQAWIRRKKVPKSWRQRLGQCREA